MSRRSLTDPSAPPAPHISVVRRPLGPSTKTNIVPTAPAPPITAAKTQQKLETQLSKAETRISDLHAEKTSIQNELHSLQTELRLASHRELKLKASNEKWERSHASLKEKSSKLNDLQTRLGELSKVHEDSKARRQKEIEELGERLRREEERRRNEVGHAQQLLAGERSKASEYQERCSKIERELEQLKAHGGASQEELREKQRQIEELQSQRESDKIVVVDAQKYARRIETELNARLDQLRSQIETKANNAERTALEQQQASEAARSELQSELDELLSEMEDEEQRHAHNLSMVAKAVSSHISALQQQSRVEKEGLMARWHINASERIGLETLADERAAQIKELVAVVKQVQGERDANKQLCHTLQSDLVSISAELSAERALADALMEQQQEGQVGASTGFGDISGLSTALNTDDVATALRAELEDVQSRTALIEEENQDLQRNYLSRSAELKVAEEALLSARTQLSTLETAVAAKSRQVDDLISQLSELEPLRRRLSSALEEAASAKKEAASQAELARSATASLQNSRLSEKAWREDRDHLASLLDSSSHFESMYLELVDATKHLTERLALAEEEKARLAAFNSELLGHNNPNQKIMYLDRVRGELDEIRRENIGLRLELERVEGERGEMERELRGYRAVDVPLGQRPKAGVVRVERVKESHTELLRRVSDSLEPVAGVSMPVKAGGAVGGGSKTPFSTQKPRFVVMPLQPELKKTLEVQQKEVVEEAWSGAVGSPAPPPLPVDTGLSLKKRRSYGSLSVHAAEEQPPAPEEEVEGEDDTLLPLNQDEPAEVATRRNKPRPTLVNSGALRHGTTAAPAASSIPVPVPKSTSTSDVVSAAGGAALRRSSLGIKARRVSELVRASTPPLPSIADFSTLDTPHGGGTNLLDGALPSPSPYGLADWTATDETSHVPALNTHHNFAALTHSTPLPLFQAGGKKFKKSRYSGAVRVPTTLGDTSATPKGRGLMPGGRTGAALVAVQEGGKEVVYEDEHDSFRKGWLYDDDEEKVELPEFSIEQVVAKKQKKVKGRGSMKVVKPGPMARTFFR